MMRGKNGKGSFKSNEVQRVHVYAASLALSKNAATTTVTTLTASSFEDFTTFVGQFDQVTMVSLKIECFATLDPTAVPGGLFIFVWDPNDAGALAGYTSGLTERFRTPLYNAQCAHTVKVFSPTATSRSGTFVHSWGNLNPTTGKQDKIDKRPAFAVSGLCPYQMWLPSSTASMNLGYLKLYASNMDTVTANSNVVVVVEATLRWRMTI